VGGRDDDPPYVSASCLYINRDVALDWLIALPFGDVSDGQPEDCFRVVGDSFRWALDEPRGTPVGFEVLSLTEFDPAAQEYMELWHGPRFDAPLVALRNATAGEIVVAAKAAYGEEPTLNRLYFDRALGQKESDDAIAAWRLCLGCGDSMASYGLGYSLLDAGRPREAYAHLRYYAELAPTNAWAWCYVGQARARIGRTGEARKAFQCAIALEHDGSFETDAAELLAALER
jgi:tetratricopeptide (TPR) repeat protein